MIEATIYAVTGELELTKKGILRLRAGVIVPVADDEAGRDWLESFLTWPLRVPGSRVLANENPERWLRALPYNFRRSSTIRVTLKELADDEPERPASLATSAGATPA